MLFSQLNYKLLLKCYVAQDAIKFGEPFISLATNISIWYHITNNFDLDNFAISSGAIFMYVCVWNIVQMISESNVTLLSA